MKVALKKKGEAALAGGVGKASLSAKGKALVAGAVLVRPRMTRVLAEKVAVGDRKGSKFDGVAFLQSLKK